MRVLMTHPSGVTKRVKIGFSWTFFFFGLFVPLFRSDFKNLVRIFLMSWVTLGIYALISCWTYNKIYAKTLMEQGYVPHDRSWL